MEERELWGICLFSSQGFFFDMVERRNEKVLASFYSPY